MNFCLTFFAAAFFMPLFYDYGSTEKRKKEMQEARKSGGVKGSKKVIIYTQLTFLSAPSFTFLLVSLPPRKKRKKRTLLPFYSVSSLIWAAQHLSTQQNGAQKVHLCMFTCLHFGAGESWQWGLYALHRPLINRNLISPLSFFFGAWAGVAEKRNVSHQLIHASLN